MPSFTSAPYFPKVSKREMVVCAFNFTTGASGAVTATQDHRSGCTVARTGTGQYTVTLPQKFPALIHASIDVSIVSPGYTCQVDLAQTNTLTGVVVFKVYEQDGTPVPTDPVTGSTVFVQLTLSRGSF